MTYQVNVRRAQLLQTGIDRDTHALGVVSHEVGLDLLSALVGAEAGGILGREDDLVTDTALFHPLAQPALGFFILVVVCAGW